MSFWVGCYTVNRKDCSLFSVQEVTCLPVQSIAPSPSFPSVKEFLSLPDLACFCFHPDHRIACVNDAVAPLAQLLVIDILVVGGDDHGVEALQGLAEPGNRAGTHPVRVLACGTDHRDIRT